MTNVIMFSQMMRIWDFKNVKNINSAKCNIVNKYENKQIVEFRDELNYEIWMWIDYIDKQIVRL